jgi:hypothetical protein
LYKLLNHNILNKRSVLWLLSIFHPWLPKSPFFLQWYTRPIVRSSGLCCKSVPASIVSLIKSLILVELSWPNIDIQRVETFTRIIYWIRSLYDRNSSRYDVWSDSDLILDLVTHSSIQSTSYFLLPISIKNVTFVQSF